MRSPILVAGGTYFLIVFVAGFLMGILRVLVVVPQVGEVAAVVLEVPIILVIAWFACDWVLKKVPVPGRNLDRVVVGAFALGLLLTAEAVLSVGLTGISLQEHFRSYSRAGPLIGLAAQLLFASFPLIRAQSS